MSIRYPGGLITKTPTTPSTSSAPGIWTMEQALEYIKAGTWPNNSDPYFKYVTLLLHGNGTNGAQNNTFLDSSTNNYTITRNGNPTQGSFSPFSRADGEWSNSFDGSGDNLVSPSSTQFTFGTGDFTIEGWARLNSSTQYYPPLFAIGTGDSTGETALAIVFGNDGYGYRLGAIFSGTFIDLGVGTGITQSSFTGSSGKHFAMVRNGSTLTIYIDGTSVYSTSNSVNYSGTYTVRIAGYSTIFANGSISNFRIVKGTAVYTANFTPPTSPLTAITNTSLLTCQSNRFKDNSTNAFTLTVNGNPSVQVSNLFNPATAYTAASNGGSGYFDGTGDYLTYSTPASNVRDWWTTNWTCEAWVYPTTLTGWSDNDSGIRPTLVGNMDPLGDTDYWSFGPDTNGQVRLIYYSGTVTNIASGLYVRAGEWSHIAWTRTSSGIQFFVNGVGSSTTAAGSSLSSSSVPLTIGSHRAARINGYVGGLRIIYGTAQYSGATYTVPTTPFTAVTNTSLLLNFTNGGIFDNAAMNDLETVGNAQISTAQSKFGGSSIAFDGDTDCLSCPSNETVNISTGDFTIEFWAYWNSFAADKKYVLSLSNGSSYWQFRHDSTDGPGLYISNFTKILSQGNNTGWSTGTWYHVALVRNGSAFTIYRNGTSVATGTSSAALGNFATFGVGGIPAYPTTTMNGYIDDLRITKGYARYTANFTPPTAPFPDK